MDVTNQINSHRGIRRKTNTNTYNDNRLYQFERQHPISSSRDDSEKPRRPLVDGYIDDHHHTTHHCIIHNLQPGGFRYFLSWVIHAIFHHFG